VTRISDYCPILRQLSRPIRLNVLLFNCKSACLHTVDLYMDVSNDRFYSLTYSILETGGPIAPQDLPFWGLPPCFKDRFIPVAKRLDVVCSL